MALLLGAALSAPAVAVAAESDDDAEILRMAKEHYKLGLDAFKAEKYPEAIKELKKAYLLKRLPALLINIAKTYEKLNDLDNEIYYYKKYLAEAPPEAKDRDTVKKTLEELAARKSGKSQPEEAPVAETPTSKKKTEREPPPEEEPQPKSAKTKKEKQPEESTEEPAPKSAKTKKEKQPEESTEEPAPRSAKTKKEKQPEESTEEPPKSAKTKKVEEPSEPVAPMPQEWAHTPIDAVPPKQPVDVRVSMPVMKGVKVFLFYRGKGQADYTPVEMKRRGGEKVGRIPADELVGKSIQYYIEAKDTGGTVVKGSGSQTDPNIVMIDPSAQPQFASFKPSRSSESSEEPSSERSEASEKSASSSESETPPGMKKKSSEEEEAPLGPNSGRKKKNTEEVSSRGSSKKKAGDGIPTIGIVGIAVAAFGVVAIAVGGGTGYYYAGAFAQAVRNDACPDGINCRGATQPYYFGINDDPNSNPADHDKAFQDSGKAADLGAGISVGIGVACIVGGVALALVPTIIKAAMAPPPKKKKKRRPKPKPVEEEEYEESTDATPPPGKRSSPSAISNIAAAPYASPRGAGLSVGFSF